MKGKIKFRCFFEIVGDKLFFFFCYYNVDFDFFGFVIVFVCFLKVRGVERVRIGVVQSVFFYVKRFFMFFFVLVEKNFFVDEDVVVIFDIFFFEQFELIDILKDKFIILIDYYVEKKNLIIVDIFVVDLM